MAELGADCLRINPGNIGREDRVRAVVDAARYHRAGLEFVVVVDHGQAASRDDGLESLSTNPRCCLAREPGGPHPDGDPR